MVMDKIFNWFKSKTVWFGLLLQMAPVFQEYYGAIGDPRGYMIVGVLVIVLRAITTKSLNEK